MQVNASILVEGWHGVEGGYEGTGTDTTIRVVAHVFFRYVVWSRHLNARDQSNPSSNLFEG